jgi:hypothetical protein
VDQSRQVLDVVGAWEASALMADCGVVVVGRVPLPRTCRDGGSLSSRIDECGCRLLGVGGLGSGSGKGWCGVFGLGGAGFCVRFLLRDAAAASQVRTVPLLSDGKGFSLGLALSRLLLGWS